METSSTTTKDDRCDTPISSVYGGASGRVTSLQPIIIDPNSCPSEGRLFIIRDPNTELVIGLNEGILTLVPERNGYVCGIYWLCVESENMWLGFRNAISGTYIGHDNKRKFIADKKWHRGHESFCVRQHPDGGHVMLVRWSNDGFLPMRVEGRTELVVSTRKHAGTAWEFIQVEHSV
ncbi:hypothetical protein N7508_002000 [Penicillium antarcticum]|uniref:uncharacterized protein n=1 Tax=Penicillium antarcticum TaxID=416450 RepID=UPI002389F596|nr:uncharacterized protein N7508_002000 [Penicillium antarcticum]KAJ5317492.1 hypothetical protein N7508_002000 [Penicillium antarcticum]